MWGKSPILLATSFPTERMRSIVPALKGFVKDLILNFQPHSFQFGQLKHLCQDIQDLTHSSCVIIVSNYHYRFVFCKINTHPLQMLLLFPSLLH